ncbi:protein-export chaperone SecB [Alkalicaulis satelles]|uniref:Protein-export protein SecB n=1 Tax=Alkalicaulis satelles TaxID=2609175 RepID=A0A5M6ZNL7_9PROT|nr:protein-export chaperone SecB [Alkalicaulis satelles]KAA5803821.1 protein-export chaperone SecB [Alkalicaulis satelles]
MTDAPAPQPGGDSGAAPMIRVLGQYVKDLSFENPNAPDSLRGQGQPEIDLSVDVNARALDDETFEVVLVLSANAKAETGPLFIAELTYAGLFAIRNLDERAREPFLLIECPRLIFPFARRILADATRDGGFPPLMLEPVDFAALYRQQLAQQQSGGAPQGTA